MSGHDFPTRTFFIRFLFQIDDIDVAVVKTFYKIIKQHARASSKAVGALT